MKQRSLLWFFIFTFTITWGLASVYFLFPDFFERTTGEMSLSNPIFILAVWGPTLAAILVTGISEGKGSIVRLLKRFIPVRSGIIWYLLVLFVLPVSGILMNVITNTAHKFQAMPAGEFFSLLIVLLITGPLGEELGWRGFALPRLLKRYSATVSGLILGLIWGLWHLPSFYTPGTPQSGLQIPFFLTTALALSITCTWVYIQTKGSVFHCFLLHFAMNFTATIIGMELKYMMILQLLFALIILIKYGWNLTKTEERSGQT